MLLPRQWGGGSHCLLGDEVLFGERHPPGAAGMDGRLPSRPRRGAATPRLLVEVAERLEVGSHRYLELPDSGFLVARVA